MDFGFIGPNAGDLSRGTALEWRRKTSGIARGWRFSRSAHGGFVLDALELVLHDRRPLVGGLLVHPSNRRSQYVSIRFTELLAEVGLEPSLGEVGDSQDALAETINGLYKAEVISRKGP